MEPNEMKAAIYEAMAVINRSFEQIIGSMAKLETMNIVTLDYVVEQEIITSELWARTNCHILANVNDRELGDRSHFSRMRANLEKRNMAEKKTARKKR